MLLKNDCQQKESVIDENQYDRKIYKRFWNETDWKGAKMWWEMMNKLTKSSGGVRVTEDKMDDQSEVFCVREKLF